MLDDVSEAVHLYTDDEAVRVLKADEMLTLPSVMPDFQVEVRRFFA